MTLSLSACGGADGSSATDAVSAATSSVADATTPTTGTSSSSSAAVASAPVVASSAITVTGTSAVKTTSTTSDATGGTTATKAATAPTSSTTATKTAATTTAATSSTTPAKTTGSTTAVTTGSTATKTATASTSTSTSTSSTTPAKTTSTTTTAPTSAVSSTTATGTGSAAILAAKLGRRGELLVGLGGQGNADPNAAISSQSIHVDIYERYLGEGDWTNWNSSPDYVGVVTEAADSFGAIPMFTQYQMANDGENNMAALQNASFMSTYWSRLIKLFKDLGTYNKPSLVNLEPDFWGFTEQAAKNGDPTTVAALVSSGSVSNPDCAAQPNNVKGLAQCMLVLARKYAPKAYIGFPPSSWGATSEGTVIAWMNALGAQNADFIVEQTLDRDAGCFEVSPQPSNCSRTSKSAFYWDETNTTHPNFTDALALAAQDHAGIGNLPLIWWQTPMGVPSTTPGGSAFHYRDNRAHYFLTHPAQLVAAGGLGVVFGAGEATQTNITTDGGQMARLTAAYEAAPAMLP